MAETIREQIDEELVDDLEALIESAQHAVGLTENARDAAENVL